MDSSSLFSLQLISSSDYHKQVLILRTEACDGEEQVTI